MLFPLEVVLHGRTGRESTLGIDRDGLVVNGALGGSDNPLRIHCQEDILLRVASGEVNLAQATQDGEVRLEADSDLDRRHGAVIMKALALLLRAGSGE